MGNYSKTLGEGFSAGQLGAALNYNLQDKYGGQKIGGLYLDGVLKAGGSVQRTHEKSTTQNYELGARRVTADGRVFKYAKATNILTTTQHAVNFQALCSDGKEATMQQAQSDGDTSILMADITTTATKDELRGAYVMIHTTSLQQRCVTGNTIASGGNIIIYLDEPLAADVASGTYTEIYPNPYGNVQARYGYGTNKLASVAGMPAVVTTANNQYLWIQTWGPIFINPYDHIGNTPDDNNRIAVFDYEGKIAYDDEAIGFSADSVSMHQRAGFVINRQTSGVSGPPLIMLTITPW